MMEQIMTDVQKANPKMNVILLRYFNPVGAHFGGRTLAYLAPLDPFD